MLLNIFVPVDFTETFTSVENFLNIFEKWRQLRAERGYLSSYKASMHNNTDDGKNSIYLENLEKRKEKGRQP